MSAPLTDDPPASDAPAPGSVPLNKIEHEIYARERVYGLPITHAAERAGLSKRSGAGSKIEALPEVQERMAWLRRDEDEIIREKRRRLEERQWLIHNADPKYFYDVIEELVVDDDGVPKCDAKGRQIIRKRQVPKPFDEVAPELRPVIKTLTYTDSGRANLVLYDKQDANREIRKLLGLDAPSKFAPTKPDGSELSDTDSLKELADAMLDLANRLDGLQARKSDDDEPAGGE